MLIAVEQDVATNNVSLAAVPALPELVADDSHPVCLGFVFFRKKDATQRRCDAKQGEELSSHSVGLDFHRLAVTGEIEAARGESCHVLEGLVTRFPVGVVCRRGRVARKTDERSVFPNHHKPVGLVKRQRTKQHRANQAEDRCVSADSQSHDHHTDNCESGLPSKHSKRKPQILEQIVHVSSPCQWSLIAEATSRFWLCGNSAVVTISVSNLNRCRHCL